MFKEILKEFGLELIGDVTKERNAYLAHTNVGKVCIKERTYDVSTFQFIYSILDHLGGKGFLNLPIYLEARDGKKFFKKQSKKTYTVCKWIHSRRVDFNNEEELKSSVSLLSEFHHHSLGFDLDQFKNASLNTKNKIYYGKILEIFSLKLRQMYQYKNIILNKEKRNLDLFDMLYLDSFDAAVHDAKIAIRRLSKTQYYEKSMLAKEKGYICHHDLEHHNILIDQNSKLYLIDFDYMIADTYLHDVASLIFRNNRSLDFIDNNRHKIILDAYQKYVEFDSDDIEIIAEFLRFPEDYWQVGHQKYDETLSWADERYVRRIEKYTTYREERLRMLESIKEYKKEVKNGKH